MNAGSDECVEACNGLLKDELAAIETYTRAIGAFPGESERAALQAIRAGHANNAALLCDHLVEMGAVPVVDAHPWESFVNGSSSMGASHALSLLREGEERVMHDYEDALRERALPEEVKNSIRESVMPSFEGHLAGLERLDG